MKYTQIPTNTYKNLQLNAGILCDSFTPASGTIGNLIGATTGGVNFKATPTYIDKADGIDNAPKNMKEMKQLDYWEATMSGTFLTITAAVVKDLLGAAKIDSADDTHIVPQSDLAQSAFDDVWWIGDYSDVNEDGTSTEAGYCAIHLKNALSVDGFQIQSADKEKGKMAFNYMAHYSSTNITDVPFEIYIKAGA